MARNGAGGVGIYISEHLNFDLKNDLYEDNLEIIWLELKLLNTHPILVGYVYRHPKSPAEYFTNLSTHLDKVSSEDKEVYFLGGMNMGI